ncbi:MAG TPA: GNAT family N-acetyltransferase [Kofleriaceae bacterium]|nr:GNAT family N-acetyltransferase [Kofleriaceae bacterium]
MDRKGLDFLDARDPRTEQIWRSLEAIARPSYFLSWAWIENWLAALPADELPSLAVVHDGCEPSAAFFLAKRRVRRNLVMSANALYFNATGSPQHDALAIEHNGMLAAPGAHRSLAAVLDMLPADWDELYLPALDCYAFDDLGAPSSPLATRYKVTFERDAMAPYVDLEAVRSVDGGYEALLPSSTRTQLQRTRSMLGALDIEVATDEAHAMDIYDELLGLHAKRWAFRGRRSAFVDPWFERVQRQLILKRLGHAEIQLVRIRSGGKTLGCLYNLVSHGHVMFYQCGLATFDEPHLKPGYVCQAAAIEYNALAGHAFYDLIGGRARYMGNLATGSNRLIWLRVQRSWTRLASINESVKRWRDAFVGESPQPALRPA